MTTQHEPHHDPRHHNDNSGVLSDDGTVVDPVCGMTVDPTATSHHFEHDGTTYHFCGAR